MNHSFPTKLFFAVFSILCFPLIAYTQGTCVETYGAVYNVDGGAMRGNTLVARPENDGFYLGGLKNDSAFVARFDLQGNTIWSKTFDVVPGVPDNVTAMILDSDGMLALAGTGGDLVNTQGGPTFAFRFNPNTNQVLWAKIYTPSETRSFCWTIVEKAPGGHYLISTNPVDDQASNVNSELFEVDRLNGNVAPGIFKNYDLGSSEDLTNLVFHNGALYGTGRFTDGPSPAQMRYALAKIDPSDGHMLWSKIGFRPKNLTARLYGLDMLIHQDTIYSIILGDPDGGTTSQTNFYVQKTSLNGDLIWLKQYDLPGSNDWGYEVLESDGGIVILASSHSSPYSFFLFKIDFNGKLLWAKSFPINNLPNSGTIQGAFQLIEVGGVLVFTGYASISPTESTLFLMRTDLDGNPNVPCADVHSINIPVIDVDNPVFYDVQVIERTPDFTTSNREMQSHSTFVTLDENCVYADTIYQLLEATICQGQSFEGYTISGTYEDVFTSIEGCDSIRTLVLHVTACAPLVYYSINACSSFMSNGSNMDYSEFTAEYPTNTSCATINATNLFRTPPQENKHSCTPGVNSSIAMCISALGSCTYIAGHSASLVTEITVTPNGNDPVNLSRLEFYERSPLNYVWISGGTGPNNYPKFYGLRILKNGQQIYLNQSIATHADWTLQSFDLSGIAALTIDAPAVIRIEFLPYCPVGNGAPVSAWDIDEINLIGGCFSGSSPFATIAGDVKTNTGAAVPDVQISIDTRPFGTPLAQTNTDHNGQYEINELQKGQKFYAQAHCNLNWLAGVNTQDLIAIQKHLLGISSLHQLPQIIAADVNRSGTINTLDLVVLKRLLLGMDKTIPFNTSWRIGNCTDVQSIQPKDFYENQVIAPVTQDEVALDFLAIKTGDVNGDFSSFSGTNLESRSLPEFHIGIRDQELLSGQEIIVPFVANSGEILEGIQIALQTNELELVDLLPGAVPITPEHYYFHDGQLKLSWMDAYGLQVNKDDVLWSFVFKVRTNSRISEALKLTVQDLKAEAYAPDHVDRIKLIFDNHAVSTDQRILNIQVNPNPFSSIATVTFENEITQPVSILINDVTGKVVYKTEATFDPGLQKLSIHKDQLHAEPGILYLRLCSGHGVYTTRLILMR